MLPFQIDRGHFQQIVLSIHHHMLRMRLLRAALQPALNVKIGDQLGHRVVTQLRLALAKQQAAGGVRQFHPTFGIQRQHRLRHRYQQRAERQVFTFRRHPRHGAHVRHAGDTADLSHQAAERGEFQFGEIEVNSANRVNIDTAQVNTTQHQQIEQFTSQTETVFTKDFKTHGSVHPKSANDGRIIGQEWVFGKLTVNNY